MLIGYQVVVDGIVGPWFLDVFRLTSRAHGVPLHYLVPRPDEKTVLARAAARSDNALTDAEPIRGLYRQFTDLGRYETHVLDSTGLTVEETVDAVLRAVRDQRYALADPDRDTGEDA